MVNADLILEAAIAAAAQTPSRPGRYRRQLEDEIKDRKQKERRKIRKKLARKSKRRNR